ncbi:hypothetical protein HXX76_007976 [Chlamydomonas incerta]|uniref:Protein kinase domain-containing protein n=1 Tax=Chlamydomonas incerta TaxID=51695 RepID=A0A835SYV7_CHLIN|nr:hypothetical protein HXX76_007976 [Chlamydomonas incerta]|eukprot:KAG2434251.1 hypothetical protein HXX76_007976 [Chlamydomonas incerta]
MSNQICAVKTEVGTVKTEVGTVKTEVSSVKTQMQAMQKDIRSTATSSGALLEFASSGVIDKQFGASLGAPCALRSAEDVAERSAQGAPKLAPNCLSMTPLLANSSRAPELVAVLLMSFCIACIWVFTLLTSVFTVPTSVFTVPTSVFTVPTSVFTVPTSVFTAQIWLLMSSSLVSNFVLTAPIAARTSDGSQRLAEQHKQIEATWLAVGACRRVHGDLSGWNVMLCSAGAGGGAAATQGGRGFVAKVADFGLSRTLEIRSKMQTHSYGTLSHMPRELVMHGTMSRAVDVYSFGILLWQMYTGQRPWAGLTHSQIIMMIGSGTARLNFPAATPAAYEALMRDCTAPDPDRRPAFTDIVKRLEAQVADAQSQDLSGTF